MKKIVDENVVDIIPCSSGIVFSRKELVSKDKYKVSFYAIDINKMKAAPIMRSAYLRAKFGESYRHIVREIEDYLSCDAAAYEDGCTILVYPTGETAIFNQKGKPIWVEDLLYHDMPVCSAIADGQRIWCAVPAENSIVSYSPAHKKFHMRIGSKTSTAFERPVFLQKYGNELFVCSAEAHKVRSVQLKDYSVQDFRSFDEPVYRYLRVCGKEIVQLASGVYIL